jgi:hypothetical protein
VKLIRGYFKLGGHHVQFNVVDAATLRAAREHPEEHRDLIVRVAGYSAYFDSTVKPAPLKFFSKTDIAKKLNVILKSIYFSRSDVALVGSETSGKTMRNVKKLVNQNFLFFFSFMAFDRSRLQP